MLLNSHLAAQEEDIKTQPEHWLWITKRKISLLFRWLATWAMSPRFMPMTLFHSCFPFARPSTQFPHHRSQQDGQLVSPCLVRYPHLFSYLPEPVPPPLCTPPRSPAVISCFSAIDSKNQITKMKPRHPGPLSLHHHRKHLPLTRRRSLHLSLLRCAVSALYDTLLYFYCLASHPLSFSVLSSPSLFYLSPAGFRSVEHQLCCHYYLNFMGPLAADSRAVHASIPSCGKIGWFNFKPGADRSSSGVVWMDRIADSVQAVTTPSSFLYSPCIRFRFVWLFGFPQFRCFGLTTVETVSLEDGSTLFLPRISLTFP